MQRYLARLELDLAHALLDEEIPFSYSKNPLLSALLYLELLKKV